MNQAEWLMIGMLTVLNLPVFWFIRRVFFPDWAELMEAIRYWFTPDMWSFFRGEFFEDFWAEIKLGLYFACCVGLVMGEFGAIMQFLGGME